MSALTVTVGTYNGNTLTLSVSGNSLKLSVPIANVSVNM